MKSRRSLPLVLAFIILTWGCGGPTVQTDFDPAADFTTFRTYAFARLTDLNQGSVLDNSLVRKRLEQMVGEQLNGKGLQQVEVGDKPDLLVHYWVGKKEKQRVEGTGPTVGVYGRRGPYGYGSLTKVPPIGPSPGDCRPEPDRGSCAGRDQETARILSVSSPAAGA